MVVTGGPGENRSGGYLPGSQGAAPESGAADAGGESPAVAPLLRRQARLGLCASALLTVLLGLLPVVLRVMAPADPGGGVPLVVWLALGFAPYPVLVGIGWWYVRRAERNEREFTEVPREA
ncbi:hypothetical protein ACGFYV_33145 [Streptomyces sp. NPDC048297]|uniref:hypothetical protein n=1 Tax=Streptomyces sp. NPDC048297 TaxID=3365531 RepID=UPI0037142EC9